MGPWLLLIKGDLVFSASLKKVIPACEFSELLKLEELVQKTYADVDTFLEEARTEALALKEKAKQEGYQEGLTQWNEEILKLDQEKKRLFHELHKLVLPIVLSSAKKIVNGELKTHPETIVNIVLQALAPILQNRSVTIYVHKNDKAILEAEKGRLKEKLDKAEIFLIKEREDISPGGCMIETESGIINANVENQWTALETALSRYLKYD